MQIAHKIELKANNTQMTYFKKACVVARFAWNWGLAEWDQQFKSGQKPSDMGSQKAIQCIKRG